MNLDHIKASLLEVCMDKVAAQLESIQSNLDSIKESRDNETKSSAGDKFETGRAMMQTEYQKAERQLLLASNTKQELANLDLSKQNPRIGKSALVETSNGFYFISVGMGKVYIDDALFYCISIQSPIGLLLKGKTVGETITFNGKTIEILKIS